MGSPARSVHPSLAELLDSLAIYQIKEVLDAPRSASYATEAKAIESDIDGILNESDIPSIGDFLRLVIALAQINLHIWHVKDEMQTDSSRFDECTKLGHQLNGIRNQLKNRILTAAAGLDQSGVRTNVATDDLEDWQLSILTGDPDS